MSPGGGEDGGGGSYSGSGVGSGVGSGGSSPGGGEDGGGGSSSGGGGGGGSSPGGGEDGGGGGGSSSYAPTCAGIGSNVGRSDRSAADIRREECTEVFRRDETWPRLGTARWLLTDPSARSAMRNGLFLMLDWDGATATSAMGRGNARAGSRTVGSAVGLNVDGRSPR